MFRKLRKQSWKLTLSVCVLTIALSLPASAQKPNKKLVKQALATMEKATKYMLDTVSTVKKLVAFYVHEHNTRLPHSAFRGQTPDEMYFNTGNSVPSQLEAARRNARQARAEANRKRTCSTCEPPTVSVN